MSNNNNASGEIVIIGFVVAIAYFVLLITASVALFVTFVLTFACLLAWDRPLRMGRFVIYPRGARWFIVRGVLGATLLPTFIYFCELYFGFHFNWNYLNYVLAVGYVGGSLGIEYMLGDDGDLIQRELRVYEEPEILPSPPATNLVPLHRDRAALTFQYASWDDDEDRT